MRFTREEIRHLAIAWVAISMAFGILFSRSALLSGNFQHFLLFFMISLLTVGIAFVVHEMLHKYMAQNYGLWAEFRMDPSMLIFAIFLAVAAGFVFAAPGAVYISGSMTREQNGKISVAGPISNLIMAWLFYLLTVSSGGLILAVGRIGDVVNAMLALFNLLPFGVLDGRKVLAWNKSVFGGVFIASFLTFLFFWF
jgi:Zn-dependent protease